MSNTTVNPCGVDDLEKELSEVERRYFKMKNDFLKEITENQSFDLADYQILGEELLQIQALGDLFCNIRENMKLDTYTFEGIGRIIRNLADQLEWKIDAIDEKCRYKFLNGGKDDNNQ